MTPMPFTLDVPQDQLDDLHHRLQRVRWPQELDDAGWDYGMPVAWVREVAEYWRTGYDWRAAEARINALDNVVTEIDGQRLHAIHVPSANPDATPLTLTHGWPGSVVELLPLVSHLTDDFHLVIPSLPGFGLSGPTTERGWGTSRIAAALAELMTRLGYDRFLAHGGDFGGAVSRELAVQFPERLLGLHTTELLHAVPDAPADGDADDERAVALQQRYQYELSGYAFAQAQRPQTLAFGLADSPVFQLAWIAERFRDWTAAATPDEAVDRDTLLTNVMLYWLTDTAASSSRIYREQAASWGSPKPANPVPTAVALTPANIAHPSRRVAETTENLVRWTHLSAGGHFPGLEIPEELAGDIKAFAAQL